MDRAFRRNTFILAGSLTAILVLYVFVYWLPQRRSKLDMLDRIQSKRDAIENYKLQGAQLANLNNELGLLAEYNEKMAERIPSALNVKDFLATVHSLGQREEVTISAVTPGLATDLVGSQQQPVSLTLIGDFPAIVRVIYELETMNRMVDLSDLDIRPLGKAGSDGQLEAKVNVQLYARPAKSAATSQNDG
jgi:Tfp pilus assembly protein PilO